MKGNGAEGTPPRRSEGTSEASVRAAPEPAAHTLEASHAVLATHGWTMMPAHGRTAIAPAAHEGEESSIPRTAEQRRQNQNDDDEAQR